MEESAAYGPEIKHLSYPLYEHRSLSLGDVYPLLLSADAGSGEGAVVINVTC